MTSVNKTPESVESLNALLTKLSKLKQHESSLDKEINDIASTGVDESDSVAIMNALHSYNDIKDTVSEVFNILSKLKNTTSMDLHLKYNIPVDS